MPSARLLSEKEKRICTSLRLTPSQYIAIKGLMIKVSHPSQCLNQFVLTLSSLLLQEKSLPKKQKSGLENLDDRVRKRLHRFFLLNGWISNQ